MELPSSKMIIKWTRRILPVLIGALGGYLYYYYIGCVSGSCAITSNPWLSTVYGALFGSVFTSWKSDKAYKKKIENY